MKNKALRVKVLEDGTFSHYKEDRKTSYQNGTLEEFQQSIAGNEVLLECERIRKARYQQIKKVKEHLLYWINKAQCTQKYEMFFATFTFTDEALQLKQKTRHEGIVRLLSKVSEDFIMNIDYGKTTQREHYHAVVVFDKDKIQKHDEMKIKGFLHYKIDVIDTYKYGNYDMELININNVSAERLAYYLVKLVLHSVKVKQQYISVKKGSSYQQYQQLTRERKRMIDSFGIFNWSEKLSRIDREIEYNIRESTKTLDKLHELFGDNLVIT